MTTEAHDARIAAIRIIATTSNDSTAAARDYLMKDSDPNNASRFAPAIKKHYQTNNHTDTDRQILVRGFLACRTWLDSSELTSWILEAENANIPEREVARLVGISHTAVRNRLARHRLRTA